MEPLKYPGWMGVGMIEETKTIMTGGRCQDCTARVDILQIPQAAGGTAVLHQGSACVGFMKRFTPTQTKPCTLAFDQNATFPRSSR